MTWKKLDETDQFYDYRREDNWTVHVENKIPLEWVVCSRNGVEIERKAWLESEPTDDVLTWADGVIDRFDPLKHPNAR
jgi:hypothetical protein